jgi:hypothetical protein
MYLEMLLLMRMFFLSLNFIRMQEPDFIKKYLSFLLISSHYHLIKGEELMHDHMFNPNSSCEEVCAGNEVDLADAENGGEFHEDSAVHADAENGGEFHEDSAASPPTSAGETTSSSAPGFPAETMSPPTSAPITGADPTADLLVSPSAS